MIEGWQEQIDAAQALRFDEDEHGRLYERIPHSGDWPCRDCACLPGQLHVPGCLDELCSFCGSGQAALCSGCDLPD